MKQPIVSKQEKEMCKLGEEVQENWFINSIFSDKYSITLDGCARCWNLHQNSQHDLGDSWREVE